MATSTLGRRRLEVRLGKLLATGDAHPGADVELGAGHVDIAPRPVNERVPRLGLFAHYNFAASFVDCDLVELEMISPPLPHLQELPEWTPRRQQLYDRLAERAAPLAGMYEPS